MKNKKNTKKKIIVSLSLRDFNKLTALAKKENATRPVMARRLLGAKMAEISMEKTPKQSPNQLGLFDSLQYDIFNGTSKASE
ncbi:MAG: hypothetical protein K6D59_10100 [Bacteroidales bacterium]|nr:hypothetical protein [Bacteroidales bacterium]